MIEEVILDKGDNYISQKENEEFIIKSFQSNKPISIYFENNNNKSRLAFKNTQFVSDIYFLVDNDIHILIKNKYENNTLRYSKFVTRSKK